MHGAQVAFSGKTTNRIEKKKEIYNLVKVECKPVVYIPSVEKGNSCGSLERAVVP